MNIDKISFQGYKAFSEEQQITFKPLTLLIGKNSSGKSAIAKLMTLIESSLSGGIDIPVLLVNNGVELGNEFSDLVYNKYPSTPITFTIRFSDGRELEVSIIQLVGAFTPIIYSWNYKHNDFEFGINLDIDKKEIVYQDEKSINYKCSFKGFLPTSIINIHTGENVLKNLDLNNMKILVDYIGPFRRLPPRSFSFTGQPSYKKMGIKGENAYNVLAYNKLTNSGLVNEVALWYKSNFDKWSIDVLESKYPILELVLFKEGKESVQVNIADVGQGMSQALPLVARALMVQDEPILIILEQPELHLHPAAHADLAELFADSAKRFNHTYLIETHSENFILRLRKLIVDKDHSLKDEDVIIYFIEDDEKEGQRVREITIDENGVLSDWPEGVFNENLEEILAIKKALKEKRERTK